MPSKNPIAAVGSVRNFMNIVKEVNFDEIRDRAEQAPRVLVISRTQEAAEAAGIELFGDQSGKLVEHRFGERVTEFETARYDAVVVWDPDRSNLFDEIRKGTSSGRPGNLFFLGTGVPDAAAHLRTEMMMALPDHAPAFGRWFLPFRAPAVHSIIDGTAKANAKFSLVSNVPSVIPLLGSFVSAGADLVVLTKNQVMMSYKLAAANGRELEDHTGILRELAPVVGAGFVWRTVAREATSFLPFFAGTIPKVTIAFVGSYAVGMAVDYYYRFGKKPTREQMRLFTKQAAKLAASIPLPGRDREEKAEAAIEAELEQSNTQEPGSSTV